MQLPSKRSLAPRFPGFSQISRALVLALPLFLQGADAAPENRDLFQMREKRNSAENRKLAEAESRLWQKSMRSKALESIDKMIGWAFDQKKYIYALKTPLQEETFTNDSSQLITLAKDNSYFSSEYALVGRVTEDKKDIETTLGWLRTIHKEIQDPRKRTFAASEILTKVLAYRDLKKGMEIPIPVASGELTSFKVDVLFDLWDGMPAFGLVPIESSGAAPILLFRGTDLSLLSQRGLASIISDFDTKGPGHSAFLHARSDIRRWLEKMASKGPKARVMGFSLGGTLAAYTLLYEQQYVNEDESEPSFAFNPPGVSKKIYKKWEKLSSENRPPLVVFVSRGDLISKIGWLFGEVYELSVDLFLYPIAAHVTLVSGQPLYRKYLIDLSLENQSHRFWR